MGQLHVTLREFTAGVQVPLDERTKIVVVPAVAMLSLQGKPFDQGKSFLLPRALPHLARLFEVAVRLPAKKGLVVGHVDPTDLEPEQLAKARAEVVQAWLQGDPRGLWINHLVDGAKEEFTFGTPRACLLSEWRAAREGSVDGRSTEGSNDVGRR